MTEEEARPTSCVPLESSKKDFRETDDQERKKALAERGRRLINSKQQNGKQTKFYFESCPRSATPKRSRSQAGISPISDSVLACDSPDDITLL